LNAEGFGVEGGGDGRGAEGFAGGGSFHDRVLFLSHSAQTVQAAAGGRAPIAGNLAAGSERSEHPQPTGRVQVKAIGVGDVLAGGNIEAFLG
jgi:hypothetical protein